MGLFDNVKDRILGMAEKIRPDEPDQRYFDEYEGVYEQDYDQMPADDYDQHGFENSAVGFQQAYGARPSQESVSVYTRSGRRVVDSTIPSEGALSTAQTFEKQMSPASPLVETDGYEAAGYEAGGYGAAGYGTDTQKGGSSSSVSSVGVHVSSSLPSDTYASPAVSTPSSAYSAPGLQAVPRPSSGKLPPYTIKPTSYEDAQLVARRVQTNQPVVVLFRNTPIDTARRMLDFCFGFAYGINGSVKEIASRTFVVLPAGFELSQEEVEKIKRENNLN